MTAARLARLGGGRAWLRRCVGTPLNAALTAAALGLLALALPPLLRWAVLDAVWSGPPSACRGAAGACWAFIAAKLRFILVGLYPPTEAWRAVAAAGLLGGLVLLSVHPRLWRPWLLGAWTAGLAAALWLLGGGGGLEPVASRLWGGLPLTLLLTAGGLVAGFPLGVALALARRSRRRTPRLLATAVIETVRGLPLIVILYIASLLFPLMLPGGTSVDKLLRAGAGMTLFAAAYIAEAVRAALQAVPRGQAEAALSLGLRPTLVLLLVVLPQALKMAIPSLVTIAIGFFQDTSLVAVIGVFDLLNTTRSATLDSEWLGFHDEAYGFVAAVYFVACAAASHYGLWLERRLNPERRR